MIDLIETVLAEAVPVIHEVTTGAYNDAGKWVETVPPPAPVTIMVTVQPTNGRQLMDMPEGIRTEAKYTLWSPSIVALDDVVIYAGSRYKVIWLWPRPEGAFTRAVLGLTK